MYMFTPYPPYTVYSTTHTTKSNDNQEKPRTIQNRAKTGPDSPRGP